jgi:hypothetical protein
MPAKVRVRQHPLTLALPLEIRLKLRTVVEVHRGQRFSPAPAIPAVDEGHVGSDAIDAMR